MKFMPSLLSVLSLSIIVACGGSGGNGTATPAMSNGIISGTAVKGPVTAGAVTAYAISNGAMGSQLAIATTDSQGNFQMSIGTYSGPVMLKMTGGSYIDEATGVMMNMNSGDALSAVIPAVTAGGTTSSVQVTPVTSIALSMAKNMAGGLSPANITAANSATGQYFMITDILHTSPMNPLTTGSNTTASQDMRNYGMVIAAMSQSAKDLGMASSSGMVTAMTNDASDGVFDGLMGTTSVMMGGMMSASVQMPVTTGTTGLATEMAVFMVSSMNRSGATTTDMVTLMNHLNTASGKIGG